MRDDVGVDAARGARHARRSGGAAARLRQPGSCTRGGRSRRPRSRPSGASRRRRRGDAHALLALALVASGDHRDAASHADFTARVDRFIAELGPTMAAAADDWHRGYELNRAMHRQFFGGERTELGSYDFNQARLTGVFTSGHYNCLSSAVLYVVLARAFGLPVRAVVVPTHVFVELGGGRRGRAQESSRSRRPPTRASTGCTTRASTRRTPSAGRATAACGP